MFIHQSRRSFIPAAGAKLLPGDGVSFHCTGGEEECVAHRWLSCGIDLHPGILEQFKTISVRRRTRFYEQTLGRKNEPRMMDKIT